jgi:hypothetical protein
VLNQGTKLNNLARFGGSGDSQYGVRHYLPLFIKTGRQGHNDLNGMGPTTSINHFGDGNNTLSRRETNAR